MNETNSNKLAQLEIGKQVPAARLFRNNTGMAYQSNLVKKNKDGSITMWDWRVIHAGLCDGSSDLIGKTTIVVTEDMVGKNIAVFTALEGKSATGIVSDDQKNFLNFVHAAGGIAGIFRTPEQAVEIFTKHPLLNGIRL